MNKWHDRFLDMAKLIASWSKDRSTKVGAVIVGNRKEILSMGYNGFPRYVNDEIEERHERPAKYAYTEHAERNAIYNAAYNGVCLRNSIIYVTLYPCADCARAIIQSGIRTVVCPDDFSLDRWADSFKVTTELFDEAGIEVILLKCN